MSTIQSGNPISVLDTITALHPEERAALALLAVMYAPVARTPFAHCLQKIGIRSAQGKSMTPADVPPLMEKLVGSNLAVDINGSYCCNPLLSHFLVRQTQKEGLFERYAQAVQEVIAPRESWNTLYYRSYAHCVQDIRIALYRALHAQAIKLLATCATSYQQEFRQHHPFSLICPEPLDTEWILEMPEALRTAIITFHLDRSLLQLQPADSAFGLLEQLINSRTELSVDTLKLYLTQLLLRGHIR